MIESVVLCEGYHDRAFWAGWLTHLGCEDPGMPEAGVGRRKPVFDPWGMAVTGGDYGYCSTSNGFIRIRPCHGKDNIIPAARIRLGERETRPMDRLVITRDSDTARDVSSAGTPAPGQEAVEQLVRQFDPHANQTAAGDWLLDNGATTISVVRWEAPDPDHAGLPGKQTLERLVAAAMVAAYPKRGPAVQTWLDSRPDGPSSGPKEFAWSYMAGWYAGGGCELFYRRLWSDSRVVEELEPRLRESGAWAVAEALSE